MEYPDEPRIAPEFLGHLTEKGRIIGFLLEKFDGAHACVNGLADCEALGSRPHDAGFIHGDVNKYNILIDRVSRNGMRLVDFEHF